MAARRSLWPREHGAYAQLAAPMIAALLVRGPTVAALALTIAACAAFLANEPLLVVLGHRGRRLLETDGTRARRRVIVLGAFAVAAAVAGLVLADLDTLRVAGVVAIPACGLLLLAWRRSQHSLLGELVAAIALPAAAAPIAVACGVAPRIALLLWLAWAVGYAASVLAVHRVIARNRTPAGARDRLVAVGIGAALAGVCIGGREAPLLLAALPLIALSEVLVVWPPRANHLRAIGMALVGASVAAIGLVAVFS